MTMSSERETSGDFLAEAAVWFVGFLKNVIISAVFIVFALAVVLPDLALGPQFMLAFAKEQGVNLGPLALPVPWFLSIATSGFQFLIYRRVRGGIRGASRHDLYAIIAALAIAAADTVIDVGGMTSLVAGPAQGVHIIPAHPSPVWIILAALTVGVCGFHELTLKPLLSKGVGIRNSKMGTPGAFIVEGTVWLLGFLYGALEAAFIVGTVGGVLGLDLVLGPQFLFAHLDLSGPLAAFPWILSITMTGAQALIYRRIRHGGFDRRATIAVTVGIALALLDTLLDVAGFTAVMYGPAAGARVVPPGAPPAWVVLALLVAMLCGLWEWLMEGLLSKSDGLGGGGGGGGGRFAGRFKRGGAGA
jgi:hypothetical protein